MNTSPECRREAILEGSGNSLGVYQGLVKVVNASSPDLPYGSILIARSAKMSFFPQLLRANAIITDVGGLLSHLAVHSLELGIPGVFGVGRATEMLVDGDEVVVDSYEGRVYRVRS